MDNAKTNLFRRWPWLSMRALAILSGVVAAALVLGAPSAANPQAGLAVFPDQPHVGREAEVDQPVSRRTAPLSSEHQPAETVSATRLDDLPPLPPSCVYPATCYVDQTYMDVGKGTEQDPFSKFTDGIEMAKQWGLRREATGTVIISPGHYAATGVYTYPTRLEAPAGGVVLEPFPRLVGDKQPEDCPWGSHDCNRCVPDVVGSFRNLGDHGEILGFHLGDHPEPQYNVDLDLDWWDWASWGATFLYDLIFNTDPHGHWQGVQRLMAGDRRYMVVTRDDIVIQGTGWSGFAVVYMGSRNGDGLAYRSNRSPDPRPPDQDTIVNTVLISDPHEHPGGIQVMGDILAVGTGPIVHFYDLSHPETLQQHQPSMGTLPDRGGYSGSSTSLARLQDGRYLLVVSSSNAIPLDFYISDEPHAFSDPENSWVKFSKFDRWYDVEIDTEWDAYQSMNLVTECGTGDLYLIGTGNRDSTSFCIEEDQICIPITGPCIPPFCVPNGEDWADLYKVELLDEDDIRLVKAAEERFITNHDCNLDAAAGVYVDPAGRLYLYCTQHANDGPDDSVRFMEFGPVP